MSGFSVSGRFQARRNRWQPFEIYVEASNENVARERVYAEFGSRHQLKRTQIELEEVSG